MNFLSIDQSTSSTTVFIFDKNLEISKKISRKHKQIYTQEGYIEHDANEIYDNLLNLIKEIKPFFKSSPDFVTITNQRETFVIFDKKSGEPLCNAVVWQCRRGQAICDELNKSNEVNKIISDKTGLKLDTYFPASKLKWLLNHNSSIKDKVIKGEALFGTIDTYLIYRLTNCREYLTDSTNASRTLLFNSKEQKWDKDLKTIFNLEFLELPEVKESSSLFGSTTFDDLFDNDIKIFGVIGDSQASMVANQCFNIGDTKITLGTGACTLTNIGSELVSSKNALTCLSFVDKGKPQYSFECLTAFAGATISWLENNLNIIDSPQDSEKISIEIVDNGGVYLIPAFAGLSAPYWLPSAKGMFYGITAASNFKHFIRASVESIAYQIVSYLEYLQENENIHIPKIIIDGGMIENKFLMQLISDLTQKEISTPTFPDMSAYGSLLIGLIGSGKYQNLEDLSRYKVKSKSYFPNKNEKLNSSFKEWKNIIEEHYVNIKSK